MWKFNLPYIGVILLFFVNSLHVSNADESSGYGKKKICVIGAGASGLSVTKNFAEKSHKFDVVTFEKQSGVGGLWIYTDSTTVDNHNLPVHSSVYKYLRTNFPNVLMSLPDYQQFKAEHSIVPHTKVLEYLTNYTNEFNLRQYIKLNTLVKNVKPIKGDGDWKTTKWEVKTENLEDNTETTTICDAVAVCNGHNFHPNEPRIPGLDTFQGAKPHCHVYRKPEPYKDQKVIVLGAGYSGIDITIEVAGQASKVYLSHNKEKLVSPFPRNVEQVPGVSSVNGNEFTLKNGTKIEADAILLCTGYQYYFPFIDESGKIKVNNNQIQYVYKQILNVEHPSMAFIGMPSAAVYPLINRQTKFFVAVMDGHVELPSKADMLKDAQDLHGRPQRRAHTIDDTQWEYYNELETLGGFEKLPDLYKKGVETWDPHHNSDFVNFRESDLKIHPDGSMSVEHW